MSEVLTYRENKVLESLILSFINRALPVGSRYISKKFDYSISPATIRNVMMDLEDKGYLTQPHTSAGRIPTDKGYRYYVDGLMKLEKLSAKERQRIEKDFFNISKDVDEILEKSCQVLCRISNLLGVVISPRFFKGMFQKLELVKLSEQVLMVIISIEDGLIKTITMEVQSEISKDKLEETARILNERLHGLTLQEIRDTIGKRMKDVSIGDKDLIEQFINSADKLFILEDDHIHFSGTQNIMNQPEFVDREKMNKVLELIDNQKILVHILEEPGTSGRITVTIGKEHKKEVMRHCSLVTASYNIGSLSGTLGVIGPTRMHYPKMISLVDYLAKEISNLFNKAWR